MSTLRVSRLPSDLGGIGPYSGAGAPSAGTNAIQTLTFGSGITGGTFKLRFKNQVTASISWSATNNTLRDHIDAALEALSGIGTGGVTTAVGTMTAGIGTITVTFTGINAAEVVPLMTVEVNALTGTTHVLTIATSTPGVAATGRGAATGAFYIDTTAGTIYTNTGTPTQPTWTSGPVISDVTATAAEINKLAGVTAGTSSASKAAVLGANKNLDVLALPVGGLAIGSGAGTAVTPSAAELNVLAGVTPGTSAASSAAVLGANKNLDVLALPVSGLKIGSGAGTAVTATAAQMNQVDAAFGTVNFDRAIKVAKVALTALDTGGGVLAWQNPEAGSIIVHRVDIDVTTKASAACTIDVGVTAANATTKVDNLIDGLDIGTSAGVFSTNSQAGALGLPPQKLATGKWVTGSMDSGAAAGTVGSAYIHYYNA